MNTTTLPKMGRPSLTGLSIKILGSYEYHRQWFALKHPDKPKQTVKRRWTGLNVKQLGWATYSREWRKMRNKNEKTYGNK